MTQEDIITEKLRDYFSISPDFDQRCRAAAIAIVKDHIKPLQEQITQLEGDNKKLIRGYGLNI